VRPDSGRRRTRRRYHRELFFPRVGISDHLAFAAAPIPFQPHIAVPDEQALAATGRWPQPPTKIPDDWPSCPSDSANRNRIRTVLPPRAATDGRIAATPWTDAASMADPAGFTTHDDRGPLILDIRGFVWCPTSEPAV